MYRDIIFNNEIDQNIYGSPKIKLLKKFHMENIIFIAVPYSIFLDTCSYSM